MLIIVFGPIASGVLLAFIQMGIYRALGKGGKGKEEEIPIFPILLMRGLFMTLGLIAVFAVYSAATKEGMDPWLPQWIHEEAERRALEEPQEGDDVPEKAPDSTSTEAEDTDPETTEGTDQQPPSEE